ncbi:hypothetical protein B9Z55_016222 [Caenorhabditis nigoni]|uniref:Uncharacterized protein n=1 Tax=Caenorhabditis nigoni TaxID=1611254 RepID=A0A2G5UDQ2_9PELO|nr:hypothetical protein B9Z55_016222 [Caenorhabditis nigoni]
MIDHDPRLLWLHLYMTVFDKDGLIIIEYYYYYVFSVRQESCFTASFADERTQILFHVLSHLIGATITAFSLSTRTPPSHPENIVFTTRPRRRFSPHRRPITDNDTHGSTFHVRRGSGSRFPSLSAEVPRFLVDPGRA